MTSRSAESRAIFPDVLQIRTPAVCFYALLSGADTYLIDTGTTGGIGALKKALRAEGRELASVRGILLTHGHLDHTFNAARLAELTGAWVAAPPLDAEHLSGRHPYKGWSRVAGFAERCAAILFRPAKCTATVEVSPGRRFDVWDGLLAIPFPGHTPGQTAFYNPGRKLLFSADLFASYGRYSHLPPRILNDDHAQMLQSFPRANDIDFEHVFPCHASRATPAQHAQVLRRLLLTHRRRRVSGSA